MEIKQLGNSDLDITVIGMGTWAIGGEGWIATWGVQDDQQSVAAIHHGLDLGINWIDTAPVYGLGHAEEVVGKALAGRRDQVLIATKCGRIWDDRGRIAGCLKTASLRKEVESSLRRLRVDVIDLLQIHWPDPDDQIEEGWETIAGLIHEGKVRYAGVSNFSVEQIKRVQSIYPVTSLQPPYSMIRRDIEAQLLPFCTSQGIGVLAYSPMQAGLLTGKFSQQRLNELDPHDWRRKNREFVSPRFEINLELVERVRPLAERHTINMAQLAVAWVLKRPGITAAITGVRRQSQVEDILPAADINLSPDELSEIDELLEERQRKISKINQ